MTKTICVFFILIASCQPMYGYDYALEVKNQSTSILYGVVVESSKGLRISFGTNVAGSGAYYSGKKQFPPRDKFTISWSMSEEDMFNRFGTKPFSGTIDTTSIPKDFKGVLQIYISEENKVSYKAISYSEYYDEW